MKRNCILLFAMLLALYSCGNTLKIKTMTPEEEASLTQTFTFEFNKDIAPSQIQQKWLTDEFLNFSPKITGKYKWLSPNTLIFSPDAPLKPIQEYEFHLSEKLLFQSEEFSIDNEKYHFHTPDFKVVKTEFFWANIPHQYYKANIQADIIFNYPVEPSLIKSKLSISRNDKLLNNYRVITAEPAEKISILINDISQTDKVQEIIITVASELESVYKKKDLGIDYTEKFSLPPITELEITGTASGFDGASGWLEIASSQPLEESQLSRFITTNPQKELKFSQYDNKIRIEGNFANSEMITLNISRGISGAFGGILKEDYSQDISFANLSPSISFASKTGTYLKYSGERNLELNAVNIDEVEVETARIFKNNILHYLNQNMYYGYSDDYYDNNYTYYENFGQAINTEKIVLKNQQNWLEKFNINLSKIIPDKSHKGIYLVNVSSTEDRWISTSKTIAITDLGIITKNIGDDIVVYANSIAEAEPISGVEISVISSNNQIILNGKTDENGIVKFIDYKKEIGDFSPRLITAELGDDFNYLDMYAPSVDLSRYDVDGINEYNNKYFTYFYGERNLYRPGETAHLTAIIRNEKLEPVQDFPIKIKVFSPSGNLFREFRSNVNEEGSFEISLEIPENAMTGEYYARLYTGSDEELKYYTIKVEDFVPDKIRLNLKPSKSEYLPGEKAQVFIDAEFLFGSKAANLKWTADIHLFPKKYSSKNYSDYEFPEINQYEDKYNFSEGFLDDKGQATVEYVIPNDFTGGGYYEAFAMIRVFDLNGRTVNKTAKFPIYNNQYFCGIKSKSYYYGTKENINLKTIILNKDDKPASNIKYNLKLIRYEWKSVLKQDYSGRYFYSSEEKQFVEWEKENVSTSSEKDLRFAVEKSGKYELKMSPVSNPNAVTTLSFYCYGWESSSASSFEINREGKIEIHTDKDKYNSGDKAKILFTTPFSGKMLITLEKNGILHSEYIEVKNRTAEYSLPINDDFLPNVYLSATLFKKHKPDNSTPFFVAYGVKSINVENKSNKLPVEIIAKSEIKPNTKQKITVKTAANKNVHLTFAAVDEGILQINHFKTPDPYNFFYAKRALKTISYDIYKYLLPEIVSSNPAFGGGDFDEMDLDAFAGARTNPIKSKRFKPFSYWSGIVKTNSAGQATFDIDIPNINTEIRLMAVAYIDNKFGNCEKSIKVKDDLIIEPEIPRFLAPNDELNMPVSIMNTTNKNQNVKLKVYTEGNIKLSSNASTSINVPAGNYNTTDFKIKAENAIGEGKIIIEATGSINIKDITEISVRPVSPLIQEAKTGQIRPGETITLKLDNSFIYNSASQTLSVSKFPAMNYAKFLKNLIDYPYGCAEQTISKAFPMLYYPELAAAIAPDNFKTNNPIYYVNEAIRKTEALQRYNGGISYWTTDYNVNKWVSVYALHFLVSADKAGYNINKEVLEKLIRYVSKLVKNKEYYNYSYFANGKQSKKIIDKNIIYGLYALSLAGKADVPTMNFYKSNQQLLTQDSKYLLAASFALAGKITSFYSIIPNTFAPENPERTDGYDFDSPIRANALMLLALLDADPQNKQVPIIIKYLNSQSYYIQTTQDIAFAYLAIGKALKGQANANIPLDIFYNNKKAVFSGKDLSISSNELGKGEIKIKAGKGNGILYYFHNISGLKYSSSIKEEDNFIKIRRTYYDFRTGTEINPYNIKQGQLLICKLALQASSMKIENIAVTSLLPAGFELENPRITEVNQQIWKSKTPMSIQNIDFRDDRISLFTKLNPNQYAEYYYMVRVTNSGNYSMPPVMAEAMYIPEIKSISGLGNVKISK